MPKSSYFYLMFHLKNPVEAYEFYHTVFGAEKVSEEFLPNGDPYIMVNINGCNILLRPADAFGEMTPKGVGCCAKFKTEQDLRSAYEILMKEGTNYSIHTDWHWTPLAALVTDKYGVGWLLSTY
ncbi:MAG: hypothetical protein FWE80_00705 [Oscillospiraceae bacterium]|nr:hypothetical protein [Oscillospiraceae bacterium]